MLFQIKNQRLSLHSRKMVLLSLIAVMFAMDLSLIYSDKLFVQKMNNYTVTEYTPQPAWVRKARSLVKGTPMEKMMPYLADQNKNTAAFLVSVAKKESNWGKRSPQLAGRDCYNYWGYRGHTGTITPSGYTCFSSPEEAIATVGNRFDRLINDSNLNTPSKMVVWKCGYDCSWDNPVAVKDWINDVDHYYQKFYE